MKFMTQKAWRERMKQEGTYEAYRTQLNARGWAQIPAKRQAMGKEAYRAYQHERYVRRRERNRQKNDLAFLNDVEPHLAQPVSLLWLPLVWLDEEEDEGSMAAPLSHAQERDWFQQIVDVL